MLAYTYYESDSRVIREAEAAVGRRERVDVAHQNRRAVAGHVGRARADAVEGPEILQGQRGRNLDLPPEHGRAIYPL